jgi:tetratricopeptide (TPR) repeat protein
MRVDPGLRIGEHLLYRLAPEQSLRAVQEFEQAVVANPRSAAAHAGLSIALLQTSALGLTAVNGVAERAEAASKRALQLDPNLPTAHYADGLMNLLCHWRLDRAEKSFLHALKLEPASAQTLLGYTHLKFARGQVQEALELTAQALRLDPASPLLGARYCQAFYYARDFYRAEAECRRVLDREPHYALAQYYLGLSLGWLGRMDAARSIFSGIPMAAGVVEADQAWLAVRDGDRRLAAQVLERRRELVRFGKVNATAKLLPCVLLGEMDEAFEALEAAISSRAVEILTLHVDPRLDPLRSDPRYPGVLRRVGLVPGLTQP